MRATKYKKEIGSSVDADIPVKKSAPTWTPIFQEFGSSVDADIPKIGSNMDADILEFGSSVDADITVKKSAPTWTPIFQEFGSSVDADIPEFGSGVDTDISDKKSAPTAIGSSLDTETQDKDRFRRGYRNPKSMEKTKIRSSGLPKIGKPRFVSRVDFRRIDEPRFISTVILSTIKAD
ncbi:hypothetical protein RhiirB3_454507 [Rhizophagus irregularis]|nr:hypothetical protein RhiirB3_454507 [Rhizophagus irregularis]